MNRTPGYLRCLTLSLLLVLAAAAPAMAGGAAMPGDDSEAADARAAINDPLEGLNRAIFDFNDKFYFRIVKPVSKGYGMVVPQPFRQGIKNAYQNILFPVRFINLLLQFKPAGAAKELGRFVLNTSFGVGGLFDVAGARPGLAQQEADFGQTLGVWGLGHGFYFVIPIVGPSSLRDGFGRIGDLWFSPVTYATQPVLPPAWYWSWVGRAGSAVNDFSLSLGDYEAFKNAAVEPYTAMRDAYAQYRAGFVGR